MTERDDQGSVDLAQEQESPRQRAIEAYEGARDRATDTLGEAPLIALAGGTRRRSADRCAAAPHPNRDASSSARRHSASRTARARRSRPRAKPARSASTSSASAATKAKKPIRNLLGGLTDAAQAPRPDAAVDAVRNKG